MSNIQNLTASLDLKQNLNIYATCKQFDNLNLILSIFDNSVQANLTGYTARLKAMKADQVPLIQEHIGINIDNNIVNIEADEQLTTTAGDTPIELQFIDSTGKKKASFNLVLKVVPSAIAVSASISTATYTLLEELENKLDQAGSYLQNIDKAIELNDKLTVQNTNATSNISSLSAQNTNATSNISNLETQNSNASTNMPKLTSLNTQATANIQAMQNFGDVTLVSQRLTTLDTIDLPSQNTLQKYAKDMNDGNTVIIETWGDSLYWGHASGVDPLGSQVTEPAPMTLQKILRAWFNNANISVVNKGEKGYSTSSVIGNWDSLMQNSPANIIYINYCVNDGKDGAISSEQYRSNLRTMIRTARQRDKTVILETPNQVLEFDSAGDNMGNPTRAEYVKQFVQIMRDVARELNVILIDNYITSEWYLEIYPSVTSIPDGIHPSDDLYKFKAIQMARMFLAPNNIQVKNKTFIPCTSPLVKFYGYPNTISAASISKAGAGVFAQNIKIAFYVAEPNLDIYIASSLWNNGSNACNVIVDSKIVKTLNMQYDGFGNPNPYPVDLEFKIIEKASRGFHIIELNNTDTTTNTRQIGLFYLKAKKNYDINKINYSAGAGAQPLSYNAKIVLENLEVVTYGGESHIITDITTSRWLSSLDVEVTATLQKNQGFCLFANNRSNGIPKGGVTLYLDSNTGYIRMAEGLVSAYGNWVDLSTTDYSNVSHKYRLKANTNGNITIYIDGVQVGTFTMSVNIYGGYFGVWNNMIGITKIDKVVFYS